MSKETRDKLNRVKSEIRSRVQSKAKDFFNEKVAAAAAAQAASMRQTLPLPKTQPPREVVEKLHSVFRFIKLFKEKYSKSSKSESTTLRSAREQVP